MSEFITTQGYNKIVEELKMLNAQAIAETEIKAFSAQDGDFRENAPYQGAKENLRTIGARVDFLTNSIKNVDIVEPSTFYGRNVVEFGATVKISDATTFKSSSWTIRGTIEADTSNGIISYLSPIGKALMGKKLGDLVIYQPREDSDNTTEVFIVGIEYPKPGSAQNNPYAKYGQDIRLPFLKASKGQDHHYPYQAPDRKPPVALASVQGQLPPGWEIVPGWNVSGPETGTKRTPIFKLFYSGKDTKKFALSVESAVAISRKIDPTTMRRRRRA